MASKKIESKSSVASDAYTRPITYSRSKGIIQEPDQGSIIAQSILKQLIEFLKAGIVIKENSLYETLILPLKIGDKGKNVVQENQPQRQSASIASLSVQQLHDMITNSIKAQHEGPLQTSFMYSKPYTKRIDNLRMPLGYKSKKFQQFDEKGNLKKYITHFVKTCTNAGSRGDQLIKYFV
ncbi:ty3-gypsy retrotransposon protein [Cucumis melo var. makuwa]|uniref:Ty3-gypsy retrotransposon protein n=1 Tax=Cucumis melo var. makuwa TaxID=1194695 RepID=A0A5D3DSK4_CUCMM|nr:ty3-gypsy retrotransposon protein [Cucumis melo var. makuwa]TYK26747.1 ty3-gypsy retrotransposon protein [Cucumis melo var. makuwa]